MHDVPPPQRPVPRWTGPFFWLLGLATVPWVFYLAATLPRRQRTVHYDIAWIGFDIALIAMLLVTGWLAYKGSDVVELPAAITAALLFIDAWVDLSTPATKARPSAPAGWSSSTSAVSAAGSRGSEYPMNSQPNTCALSASTISQPADGQCGTRSMPPATGPSAVEVSAVARVASASGPATPRPELARSTRMKPAYAIEQPTPNSTPRTGSRPYAPPPTAPDSSTTPARTTGAPIANRRDGRPPSRPHAARPTKNTS